MALWQHQLDGAEFVKGKRGALLWWGMGSGKTYGTINIIKEQDAEIVLIVCPKSVVLTWIKQIEEHAQGDFIVIAPTKGSVTKKATQISQAISYYKGKGKPLVVIVNYESVWRPGLGQIRDKYKNIRNNGLIKSINWDIIVADECFSKDTMIETPTGKIKIQNLRCGNVVYGYDHITKKIVKTKVVNIMSNTATMNKMVNFDNTKATATHPVFTKQGYKPIIDINEKDTLLLIGNKLHGSEVTVHTLQQRIIKRSDISMDDCEKKINRKTRPILFSKLCWQKNETKSRESKTTVNKNSTDKKSAVGREGKCDRSIAKIKMFNLWKTINNNTNKKFAVYKKKNGYKNSYMFLFKKLLGFLENATTRDKSQGIHPKSKRQAINQHEKTMECRKLNIKSSSDGKSKLYGKSICKKQGKKSCKSTFNSKGTRIQTVNWWKWNWINKSTKNIIQIIEKSLWRLLGNRNINTQQLATIQSGASLCHRHSEQSYENCDRSRRTNTFGKKSNSKRQSERLLFDRQGMDCDEILEQRNIAESRKNITVYNFETGTNNYFANSILVHNCHRLRTANSKVSKFMAFLKSRLNLGLSGTPFSTPLSPFAVFRFLDKTIFSEILPTGKVSASFQLYKLKYCIYGGFENRIVIEYINQDDLNEKIHSITHRIKTEDVIELPQFQHLTIPVELNPQAMKAYNQFKKEALLEFEGGKELTAANVLVKHLRLAQIASGTVKDDDGNPHLIDNSKLIALKDLIIGINEPIVIFTRFRAEVIQIEEMINKFRREGEVKRTVCKIVGGCDEREKFESGEADIAIVNVASGGVGLNELALCNYSIYFSSGYDSLLYEQSLARTRRSGSDVNKKVFYYHIVAIGTIDEVIMLAIEQKIDIVSAVLENFKESLQGGHEARGIL